MEVIITPKIVGVTHTYRKDTASPDMYTLYHFDQRTKKEVIIVWNPGCPELAIKADDKYVYFTDRKTHELKMIQYK